MHPLSARPAFLPDDVVFESFTFPAFDLAYNVDALGVANAFLNVPDDRPQRGMRGVYVHIPFCESICGFCPFRKSVGTEDRISAYMDALTTEIELAAATPLIRSWDIDAIYIGGGTPSVLGPERTSELLGTLRSRLRLSADVEITFEVEPKSASEEVLLAARQGGATRVSFGVQTLDPGLRKMVNLTATLAEVERTAELCARHFENTNLDMIVGFPGQDSEDAVRDMSAAISLGVGSISLYPLDYVAVLPKLLNKIRVGDLPPAVVGRERWDMFHAAREALMEQMPAQNMYCFGRPGSPKCRYMFEILYGGYHDQVIGFGLGAYSMIRGLAYANVGSEADYVACAKERRMPVGQASPGHAYEKAFVYAPKRLNADLREADELDIGASILPKVHALEEAGLVTVSGDIMTLTRAGEHQYAQIMVGFMSDEQRRLYERVCRRITRDLNWGLDGPLDSAKAAARALGAVNALPALASLT